MAKEDELAAFLNNVRHSMELLVHPLRSMVGTLRSWPGRLKHDSQEMMEIRRLEGKLQTVLTIVAEIAEKVPPNRSG